MPSADLLTPSTAFLVGDSGDIFATINGEQASLMKPGSVLATRGNRGDAPRVRNPLPLMVEVIRAVPQPPSRQVGMGWRERDVAFDLSISLRQKDPTGAAQTVTLDQVIRALLFRYSGVSDLAITVTVPGGTTAAFRRSTAEVTSVDDVPESAEFARATIRLTFTFTEQMTDNA